jgi:hypothetical protein
MGDQANAYLIDNFDGRKDVGIYAYTHWSGYEWPERVRQALAAARGRWGDPSYANRIMLGSLFADLIGDTGGGISTEMGDNAHPIIIVDQVAEVVAFAPEGEEGNPESWVNTMSFTEYVAQTQAKYPADLA